MLDGPLLARPTAGVMLHLTLLGAAETCFVSSLGTAGACALAL